MGILGKIVGAGASAIGAGFEAIGQKLEAVFVKRKQENLEYIAESLGVKANETSRQTIRRYFLKEFYKDHLKVYQIKPVFVCKNYLYIQYIDDNYYLQFLYFYKI